MNNGVVMNYLLCVSGENFHTQTVICTTIMGVSFSTPGLLNPGPPLYGRWISLYKFVEVRVKSNSLVLVQSYIKWTVAMASTLPAVTVPVRIMDAEKCITALFSLRS